MMNNLILVAEKISKSFGSLQVLNFRLRFSNPKRVVFCSWAVI